MMVRLQKSYLSLLVFIYQVQLPRRAKSLLVYCGQCWSRHNRCSHCVFVAWVKFRSCASWAYETPRCSSFWVSRKTSHNLSFWSSRHELPIIYDNHIKPVFNLWSTILIPSRRACKALDLIHIRHCQKSKVDPDIQGRQHCSKSSPVTPSCLSRLSSWFTARHSISYRCQICNLSSSSKLGFF